MYNVISFMWGMAEASIFFIVPDVALSFIAMRYGFKAAFKGLLWVLVGALIGGIGMYWLGRFFPDKIYRFLDWIPGISPELIGIVEAQISRHQSLALYIGPFKGIPYKIYTARWGMLGENVAVMVLVSIFARGLRFFSTAALAYYAGIFLKRVFKSKSAPMVALILFWVFFYIFYFIYFGW